jgi:hypothetical protein
MGAFEHIIARVVHLSSGDDRSTVGSRVRLSRKSEPGQHQRIHSSFLIALIGKFAFGYMPNARASKACLLWRRRPGDARGQSLMRVVGQRELGALTFCDGFGNR